MRTASDVISRIQWDPVFQERRGNVVVGYLDRFYGILERCFDGFNWHDELPDVGEDELAIPQHRIRYFKYRDFKIWDKESRFVNYRIRTIIVYQLPRIATAENSGKCLGQTIPL
jgi:hypothetical protein